MEIIFTPEIPIPETESRILIGGKDYGRVMPHREKTYQAQLTMTQGVMYCFFGYGDTKQDAVHDALCNAVKDIAEMGREVDAILEAL